MDLKPDPHFKRVLVPGSGWGQRPAVAPKPQYANQTMAVVCPKCKASFRHPRRSGIVLCKAAESPFYGPLRGCGWFLAIRPPYAGGHQAYADPVMDLRQFVDAETGLVSLPGAARLEFRRKFAAVCEEWERRGFTRTVRRADGSFYPEPIDPNELSALSEFDNKVISAPVPEP